MASTTVTHDVTAQDGERKKRKRAAIVKFGLVGAALVGIGAAATSAAWTDDAWFSATATAATIELEGSLDTTPLNWDVADDEATALVIPAATFAELVPGETRDYIDPRAEQRLGGHLRRRARLDAQHHGRRPVRRARARHGDAEPDRGVHARAGRRPRHHRHRDGPVVDERAEPVPGRHRLRHAPVHRHRRFLIHPSAGR